jgi:hypothetical protein
VIPAGVELAEGKAARDWDGHQLQGSGAIADLTVSPGAPAVALLVVVSPQV